MDNFGTDIDPSSSDLYGADERLRQFFDSDEQESSPIFDELKSISDRYEDFEEIASGGLKCIYSVFDKYTGRYVAMAQLHAGGDSEKYESFVREARLTASLEHPSIIKIHDIGVNDKDEPYFTMDLKKGPNLHDFLKDGKLDLRQLLIIFIKICDAVDYAHSRGVLHLDLKPANIQIGEYGEVIICDWGLGKIVDNNSFTEHTSFGADLLNDMTLHGRIKGTPGFMAPEQITGEEKTAHTDIYALGAMLYNLLTGEKAFTGDLDDLLKKTVHGKFKAPSKVNKALAKSLEAVVLKAMEVNKEDRYQTVNELKTDIEAYLSGFATNAEEAGLLKLLGLLIKRNTGIFIVACLSFIILILAAGLFISRIQVEKNVAIKERDRANILTQSEAQIRLKAEYNAELLQKLNKKYLEELTEQSSFVTDNINHWDVYDVEIYENALNKLNKALKTNNENTVARAERAKLLLIMQSYANALEDITDIPGLKYLENICLKGKEFLKDGQLDAHELVKIILLVNKLEERRNLKKSLIDKLLAFDQVSHERTIDDNILITEALIRVWNKDWNGKLIFDKKTRELTISGEGLKALRTTQNAHTKKHNILRFIKPLSLKLEDASLFNIYHIADMPLKDLDISSNSFRKKNINKLKFELLKNVSNLIVNKNQYKVIDKSLIPSWISLKVAD